MRSRLRNDVYVSSDAGNILEISKKFGVKVIKKPRKTIAGDNYTSEEALKHAIAFIRENVKEKIDIVVFFKQLLHLEQVKVLKMP